MADERLRDIERRAAQGDQEAEAALIREGLRTSGNDIVEFLKGERRTVILNILLQTGVITQGQLEQILCPSFDLDQQFESRLNKLRTFNILSTKEGVEGITAIDGKHYAPPTLEQIRARLSAEKLRFIGQLEIPTLLLVPFGMSLKKLTDKVTGQPGQGQLTRQNRAFEGWYLDADRWGDLKYFPEALSPSANNLASAS